MATESRPLSTLAKQAGALFQQTANTAGQQLAQSVLDDAGLKADDGWRVDFQAGTIHRDVPDPAPDGPPPSA